MTRTNGWVRRGAAGLAVGGVVLAGTASAAFAHECKNESRSAIGDAHAAAGNGWTLTSDVILTIAIPQELSLTPLTPEQLAEAQEIVVAEKAGGDFDEIYAQDYAVLDNATAMNGNSRNGYGPKSSDDHAIDHLFAEFGDVAPLFDHMVGIYFAVTAP